MQNRTYFFVNKGADSPSLTQSSSREKSSINSYVQRGRPHNRTGKPTTRRKPKGKVKDEPPPLPDSESSATVSSPSASSTSSGSLTIRQPNFQSFVLTADGAHTQLPPGQTYIAYENDEALEAAAVARIRTAQQTSDDLVSIASPTPATDLESQTYTPSTAPTSLGSSPHDIMQVALNPIDPFRASSIPLDQRGHSLIEYYKRVYHPAIWHVETKASPKGGYAFQTSAADVIRSAFQSDVDMYALLACMSSRLQYVDNGQGYNTDEYLGKALKSTRRALMKPAEHGPKSHEEILMVIFHLYAAEGYRDNTREAKIHMKGAKTIIDHIGGLSKLRDPQMRELLIIGDGLLSAMTLDPCELPCEYDPEDYLTATPPELRINPMYDLYAIAPAFRSPLRDRVVPASIQSLIEETAEINWVLTNAKDSTLEAGKNALRWIQMRSMAVRHRLLNLQLHDARLDALRGALVLWVVVSTTLLGKLKLGARIAPQIRTKIRTADSQALEWGGHYDIKAWILSLAAMSATSGSVEDTWLVQKLNDLIATKKVLGQPLLVNSEQALYQQLELLQKKFFYHEQVHGPLLHELVKKMVVDVRTRDQMAWR